MQRPCQAWQEHLALLSLKYWCGSKRRRSNTFPYFGSSELFSKQSLNLAEFFHQATLCMYTTSIIITWHICLESKSSWPLKLSPFLHKCKNYIKIAQPEKWQNFPRSEKRDFARQGPLEPPTQASLTVHLVQDLQPLLTLHPTVQRSDIDWLPLTSLTSRNPPFPFSDTLDWNLTL